MKGLHFFRININNLVHKIDELRHFIKTTDASVLGISETKLDSPILSTEIEVKDYDLLRLARS